MAGDAERRSARGPAAFVSPGQPSLPDPAEEEVEGAEDLVAGVLRYAMESAVLEQAQTEAEISSECAPTSSNEYECTVTFGGEPVRSTISVQDSPLSNPRCDADLPAVQVVADGEQAEGTCYADVVGWRAWPNWSEVFDISGDSVAPIVTKR